MKKLLLVFLLVYSSTVFSQETTSKTVSSSFSMKITSLEDLEEIDWDDLKAMFSDSEPDEKITIIISYVNEHITDKHNGITQENNSEFKLKSENTAAHINETIAGLKKFTTTFIKSQH
ncbi:hypothetical protein SAMN05216480_101399 [Pustulibacterium marinum]|uniref:Uncharacterized protein n=1 Tax=Pustulibacterium marinum TaxID=1224947 RepID=A0A1I7EXX2_9FLAO|nr:hypothetical protein [Pustulibacterium marinum]SFU28735.1 hypothetical protein SAMN05216480_101399 [Pustulibacterium marinum]